MPWQARLPDTPLSSAIATCRATGSGHTHHAGPGNLSTRSTATRGLSGPHSALFRDEDEIPLIGSVRPDQGRIGPQRLPDRRLLAGDTRLRWVRREIELFQEAGKGDRIIPLLIAGEPDESYPAELRRRGWNGPGQTASCRSRGRRSSRSRRMSGPGWRAGVAHRTARDSSTGRGAAWVPIRRSCSA